MKKSLPLLALVPLLAACVTTPIVSDYNGDSVKLQGPSLYSDEVTAKFQVEAQRICGKAGKTAEYASSIALPNYTMEHLYLCL